MHRKKQLMLVTVICIAISVVACSNPSTPNHSEENKDITENNKVENNTTEDNASENNASANNDTPEETDEQVDLALTKLLPYQSGYVWRYDGAVEYGHKMELIAIEESAEKVTYTVEGEVDDMSAGESPYDYTLDVTYIVTEDSLIQTVDGEVMMDNVFPELELIRLPLVEGTEWMQTQINTDGKEVELKSYMDSVEKDGEQKIYTVVYEDTDSDYYEKRQIKEGVGVLSFEHLYIFEEDSMPMGYEINYEFTGFHDD